MNPVEYRIMYESEDAHWWYRGLHELVVGTVATEHQRKGTLQILDAGCGTGRLCQLLDPFGTVHGCDFSEAALGFCRERGIDHVFQADLNHADLGSERYDVITSMDVLYHRAIRDEKPVLDAFFHALRPGGLLLINLVAYESLRSSHDIAVHTRRRYTRQSLLPLLTDAGFRVENSSYRLCLLFPPVAAYRLLRKATLRDAPATEVASDVRLPHLLVNRLLLHILRLENRLLQRVSLPFGTSIFVIARKP